MLTSLEQLLRRLDFHDWVIRRMLNSPYRRFSLHLTLEGWLLVTTMLLIGLAALNTAAPLLYLMFAMMCAFFVISALLATNTMRGLRVGRTCPAVWPAGEPFRAEISVRNTKRFIASHGLRVADLDSKRRRFGAAFFLRVPAGGVAVREVWECVFPRRGLWHLGRLQVTTRFPFGLIERSLIYDIPQDVLVLPQTINLGAAMQRIRLELGEFEAPVKGSGSGLFGLRQYTPELSARDIHWKISARRGLLIAREYEAEEKRRVSLVLDSTGGGDADAFEVGVVLAASAARLLVGDDHEVELRTGEGVVGFGHGPEHLHRMLRALATVPLTKDANPRSPVRASAEDGVLRLVIDWRGNTPEAPGTSLLRTADHRGDITAALSGANR